MFERIPKQVLDAMMEEPAARLTVRVTPVGQETERKPNNDA